MKRIKIIKTPGGEVPEVVRRAWIGLEIPIDPNIIQPSDQEIVGVVTMGYQGKKMVYSVFALTAFDLLRQYNLSAYTAYRQNAPQFFRPGKHLLFNADACELIDT